MTLEKFQKKIVKANGYDKYCNYLVFLAAIAGGLYFLYDVIAHQEKYNKHGTQYLGYLSFLFLTTLGVSGLFFVPNRYKVNTIHSTLPIDKKQQIIDSVLKEFGNPYCDKDNDYYNFTYKKKWWTSSYEIYLSFDNEDFFVSVQGVTNVYYGSGIIDFGGTEKVRKTIILALTNFTA